MSNSSQGLITCPYCSKEFEASAAFAIRVEQEVAARLGTAQQRAREEGEQTVRLDLEAKLREKDAARAAAERQLAEARKTELALRKDREALEAAKQELELNVQRRVDAARETIRAKEEERVRAELANSLREKDAARDAAEKQLAEARKTELALRKDREALEAAKQELELNVQRRVDAERESIRAQAVAKERNEADLKLRDKDILIDQLKTSINELKQRSEQGSVQLQGESQELVLSERLRAAFPLDSFEEVAKGAEGADVLQCVRDETGRDCGRILWESKRTKHWSDGWLAKLREDQRNAGATCAAIVSQALPPGGQPIQERDGVWVSSFTLAVPMASLLRRAVIDADGARRARTGRETKTELVYEYLTGPDFQRRVQGVVEAWQGMRDDLERERRAMRAIWHKREVLIDMAINGMLGIHKDVKGIAGIDVPALPLLDSPVSELEAIAPDSGPLDDDKLAEEFLRELAACGGKAGNVTLRQALGWNPQDYERIKRALVESGKILPGKGRGGSVSLTESGSDGAHSLSPDAE
jgi:hypothetical protein